MLKEQNCERLCVYNATPDDTRIIVMCVNSTTVEVLL